MAKLAAVVMAAGVSSRMGRFKPLLYVDGQTMAQRVVGYMQRAGADPVVVVTGYNADQLEKHLAPTGARFVRNERYYETQMLDSLLMGLSVLEWDTERVLLCPADIPLIKDETVQTLLNTQGDFVRPTFDGTPGHPVLVSRTLLQSIQGYDGPDGLQGAVRARGITPVDVPVDDRGTTLDGDTRDEYAELLRYRRRETGQPQQLQLDLRICLQAETACWGPDCAQFLELIQTTGSMLSACQCMHMSYSKGWKMINEIERQLGYPLLLRNQGGSNGGGSQLTSQGQQFLEAFTGMQREIRQQSQKIFQRYFPQGRLP